MPYKRKSKMILLIEFFSVPFRAVPFLPVPSRLKFFLSFGQNHFIIAGGFL
jgi:hypothetical protein